MKSKRKIGPWILWGTAALVIPFWLLSFPETTISHSNKALFIYTSQFAAVLGFALFSLTFLLSTRIKWLEDYFGGLDKIYQTHHTLGKSAFILMALHPVILALRWVPENATKALWYIFPIHRRLEINLGSWALWGIFLLMMVTLIIKLPYDKWKISHRFLGVFFILTVLHIFLLEGFVSENTPLAFYIGLLSSLAIIAIVYKSVLYHWLVKKYYFNVLEVNRLNSQVVAITLVSNDGKFDFVPGQFCFFSFEDEEISLESHPYTICSSPGEKEITIIVKALGNYTKQLYKILKPGTKALAEGPYGRFTYRAEKGAQIWIGGGVGIAPFISWAKDLQENRIQGFEADLYYCANTEQELIYLQEFATLEKELKGFRIYTICADNEGFLQVRDIEGISDRPVFICGPKAMRKALLKDLKKLNVSASKVHFEDFDFS